MKILLRTLSALLLLLVAFAPFAHAAGDGACFSDPDCKQYGPGYTCDLSVDTCVYTNPVTGGTQQAGGTNPTCPNGQYYDSQTNGCVALPGGTGAGGVGGGTTGSGGGATGAGSINTTYLKGYSDSIIGVINGILVPLLVAVAFIIFLWGVFNYFIRGAAEPEKRAEGAQFILWAVVGFAVIFSVWGLVNILLGTLGLSPGGQAPIAPTL